MQSINELSIIYCVLTHIKIHYVNKQRKWMYFLSVEIIEHEF